MPEITLNVVDPRRGVFLTREQLECWAGRPLGDEEVGQLEDALPNSSLPEVVNTVVDSFLGEDPLVDAMLEALRQAPSREVAIAMLSRTEDEIVDVIADRVHTDRDNYADEEDFYFGLALEIHG